MTSGRQIHTGVQWQRTWRLVRQSQYYPKVSYMAELKHGIAVLQLLHDFPLQSLTSTQLTEQHDLITRSYIHQQSASVLSRLWVWSGITPRKKRMLLFLLFLFYYFYCFFSLWRKTSSQVKSIVCIGDSTSSVTGKKNTLKYPSCVSCSLIDPAAFALVSGGNGHEPDLTFRDPLPLTQNARVITWPTMPCWCRANERWGRDFQLYSQQQRDSSVSPAFVRAYSSFPWRTASARNVLGPPWQLFGCSNAQHHSDAVSLVFPRRSPIQISLVNNCELVQTCFLLSEAHSADSVIQIVHAPLSGSADS